ASHYIQVDVAVVVEQVEQPLQVVTRNVTFPNKQLFVVGDRGGRRGGPRRRLTRILHDFRHWMSPLQGSRQATGNHPACPRRGCGLRSPRGPRRVGVRCRNLAPKSQDRKSTRLNSSHVKISYAVFCLKKEKLRW